EHPVRLHSHTNRWRSPRPTRNVSARPLMRSLTSLNRLSFFATRVAVGTPAPSGPKRGHRKVKARCLRGTRGTMRPESRAARMAYNESVFREANEQLANVFEREAQGSRRVPFLCECSDRACTRVVELSLEEYADVRRHPARFLTLTGHEDSDAEIVVSGGG